MTGPGSLLVEVIFAIVELGAVALSLRYVLRQKLTFLRDAKAILVFAHAFLLLVFFLEFLRAILSYSPVFMLFYTIGTISLILWIGILLTYLAYVVYYRPSEQTFRERLAAMLSIRFVPSGLAMMVFVFYMVAVDVILVVTRPFAIVKMYDWTGSLDPVPVVNGAFLGLALAAFVTFLVFPSIQYIIAIRRIPERSTRRATAVLAVGWDLIALDGLLILGFLPSIGVDAIEPGQLVASLLLAAAGLALRGTSVLADLFQPLEASAQKGPAGINRGANDIGDVSVYKGSMLLEADPSANYERAARDFAQEMTSGSRALFVFTSKGSPVYTQLREIPGVRFFILSDVSYPKASGAPLEVMVPRNDHSALLSVMNEAVTKTPEPLKAMVFDNISSVIMDAGVQEAYKFLRQVNEILSHGDVVSLFLVLSKAHDDKTMNLIKNLYSGHLLYDASGLHVKKQG